MKECEGLTVKIIKLLESDPGQPVKDLAKKLGVNRTSLAGYLKALENQDYVKSKRIGPAKVYFDVKEKEVRLWKGKGKSLPLTETKSGLYTLSELLFTYRKIFHSVLKLSIVIEICLYFIPFLLSR